MVSFPKDIDMETRKKIMHQIIIPVRNEIDYYSPELRQSLGGIFNNTQCSKAATSIGWEISRHMRKNL